MPLNDTKIHPLSQHALAKLLSVSRRPQPILDFNPGVRDRLLAENLVEQVALPSPFKSDKGGSCPHFRITDAGRAALAARGYA